MPFQTIGYAQRALKLFIYRQLWLGFTGQKENGALLNSGILNAHT